MYKRKFIEMAFLGNINDLRIELHTDHNPPHFYVIKKDEYDARVNIKTKKIINYKFQKNNNCLISSDEYKNILKWLNSPSKKSHVSNLEKIEITWDALNPNSEI